MSDLYGQCEICGGNLLSDHSCLSTTTTAKDKIDRCPYCDSSVGYYQNIIVSQSLTCGWDGKDLEDNATPHFIRGGKRKYCQECGRDVTKFVEHPDLLTDKEDV